MDYLYDKKQIKWKLKKSKNLVKKEMDLEKFIHRQRVTLSALMGLLSGS